MSERELLRRTAEIAADFVETLDERSIWPPATVDELRAALGGPLPEEPSDPLDVIEALAAGAEPGVVGIPSGRYFGFVIGGALPAALAADWLTSAWDQNAGLVICGPSAAVCEDVAGEWLKDLLGLPGTASFAFVTGCQMAHVTCLAAARHDVLERVGWDVESKGLAGSPPITVVTGDRKHVTVDRALRLLGLGSEGTRRVDVDAQGRMQSDSLERALHDLTGPAIVCVQAGEVNTGSFDPIRRSRGALSRRGGVAPRRRRVRPLGRRLARAAAPRRRREHADSWATDAHKWLNVPYDSGLAFVAHADAHRAAMRLGAEYLVANEGARDQMDWTPEFSRRARGFAVYAALRSLGRSGVADLVERSCARARQFATTMASVPGCEILNDVVLNQVLFRFDDDATTNALLASVQASGEAWMSGTTWDGRAAIRLSVSNWRTTEHDIDRTVAAFEAARVAV